MKKFLSLILVALLAFSFAGCGEKAAPVQEDAGKGAVPAQENSGEEVKPGLTGMQRVIILNNALEGLEGSRQCYNAKEYHKCYSLGEIADANFWFMPADDAVTKTVAYTDLYADETDFASFRGKYISFAKDNPDSDFDEYDIFVGPNQKESQDVKYKGWCIAGAEALLMVPEDGWEVPDLFKDMGMVDADAYDFICADDRAETIKKSDLEKISIFFNDEGGVDATSAADSSNPLLNIRYIVPAGTTKDSTPAKSGVTKITVALNAKGVFETEAPYSENRAGAFYDDCKAVSDIVEKHGVTPGGEVKIISYKDGFTATDDYDTFVQKYIAYQGPNEKGDNKEYFALGRVQPRDAGVANVGYYILSEDAFAFIPEAGLAVADVFKTVGMAETAEYELTYADGTTETKAAADVTGMQLAADSNLLYIKAIPA